MIVVVTGLMRSGTSFVARTLHEAGIPMGTTMLFPIVGAGLDWEDASFTRTLAEGVSRGGYDPGSFFEEYRGDRSKVSGTWGVKSPFLLPYLRDFLSSSDARLIVTSRPYEDTLDSLTRCTVSFGEQSGFAGDFARKIQKKLLPHLAAAQERADLVIECGPSMADPAASAERIRKEVESWA